VATIGDLLALVHDAACRASPARLTVSEWRHGPRSAEAWDAFMRSRHGTTYQRVPDSVPEPPDESRWSVTLSYETRERFREESAGPQAGVRYFVRNGEHWLTWDADWGLVTSDSEPDGGLRVPSFAFLLDPVELVPALRFGRPDEGSLAGRPTLTTLATPRPVDAGGAFLRVGPGADAVELSFDAETGALLRSEASIGGAPFHRLEVTEIVYEPIAPERFAVVPPDGHEGEAGRWPRPVVLPLHELATKTPFTLLVPGRVPDGWRLVTSQLLEGRERPPLEATAFLDYTSSDGAYPVGMRERASAAADSASGVVDHGSTVAPRFVVTVVRSGTWVELAGSDRDLLVELADELVPAPTKPPRL
jgi:hypothetical protein